MNSKYILILLFCISISNGLAQDYKFGKVSLEEVNESLYPTDSSAVAAYLLKKRRSYYTYNSGAGLALVSEYHKRIKIYDKNGFDYATQEIGLSKNGSDKESISSIKGMTYNVENGKLVGTKLEKSGIFKSEYSKNLNEVKITMPNVKEGSVLELKYKITSPFIQSIDEFRFQEVIPIKKVEASMAIFDYFKFNIRRKGFLFVKPQTSKTNNRDLETTNAVTTYNLSDIPALKDEPFVSNMDNYRESVKFEIVSLEIPGNSYKIFAKSWEDVVKTVYKSNSFGEELKKKKYFEEDLDAIINGVTDEKEKMYKVLAFVKDNVKWNKRRGVGTDEGVRKAYSSNTGNSGDINLMLIAMLKHAGLDANPIVLSTRDHGIQLFPTLSGLNYVIAAVKLGDDYVTLDATEQFGGPNVLPMRALNLFGRMVDKDGSSSMMDMVPQKRSVETSMVQVAINDDGSIEGNTRQRFTEYYAMLLRNQIADNTVDSYLEKMESNYDGLEITNLEIGNEKAIDKPLNQSYEIYHEDIVEEVGDKLYFSPLYHLATSESPFKSEKREFPVDFGYPWEDRFIVNTTLPEGYKVEHLPENSTLSLPEKMGSFKYSIKEVAGSLQLTSQITFPACLIAPEYYDALKEFYRQIIEKQSEKVVLSKI